MNELAGRCLCGAASFGIEPPTLFFASALCPGGMHVVRTAIAGPIDRAPDCHVFYDQRVDWVEPGDALPRYTADHPGLAKYRAVHRQPGSPP